MTIYRPHDWQVFVAKLLILLSVCALVGLFVAVAVNSYLDAAPTEAREGE